VFEPSATSVKPKNAAKTATFAASAFQHYGNELHRFLVRRLRQPQDAEDLAQEVFMRLSRIENSEFVRQPRAYLFGVASHVVSEFRIRNAHAREWVTVDSQILDHRNEHPCDLQPDELAERLNTQRQLRKALEQLPPMHLAVFLLHKRDGYSYEEIAQQLDLTVRRIETLLGEAKAQLRAMAWDR
jgi:RNA polymerase sigma-19 factor, ECF subfamily